MVPNPIWLVSLGGSLDSRQTPGVCIWRAQIMSRGNKKTAICKERSLWRNPPRWHFGLGLLALPDNTFLFKPPHPWCLVLAALANLCKKAALYLFFSLSPTHSPFAQCWQFSFLCAVNFPQNSFLRYLQQPLKLAIFMSLFINKETVKAGKKESWPLTHGYTTQVPPVTLHGSVKFTNTKKVNVQAWDSLGSHLAAARNLSAM